MDMVDDWVRELKENPRLIDIVERDVNKALDVMRKAENEKGGDGFQGQCQADRGVHG
jgi:hypothetical protein